MNTSNGSLEKAKYIFQCRAYTCGYRNIECVCPHRNDRKGMLFKEEKFPNVLVACHILMH